MDKLTSLLLGGACALLLGTAGCGGTCSTFCDYFAQDCGAEVMSSGQCSWDDEQDILDRCNEACDKARDELSDSEVEEFDACIDCMDESLGGDECNDVQDYADAYYDDCDHECDDDGAVEFFSDRNNRFWDYMNLDTGDLDC